MKTQIFQTDRRKQDVDRPQTEGPAQARGRQALACKPLNHRPNSMSGVSAGQTLPRCWGRGPHVRGVAGYRLRLAGTSKEKNQKSRCRAQCHGRAVARPWSAPHGRPSPRRRQ